MPLLYDVEITTINKEYKSWKKMNLPTLTAALREMDSDMVANIDELIIRKSK